MNVISDTPVVSTTAYVAGDAVGGLLTFNGADPMGMLHSVSVTDSDQVAKSLDLVVFRQLFTPTADNDPFTVQAADQSKLVAVISLTDVQYSNLGSISIAVANQLGIPFVCGGENAALYGQLVARDDITYTQVDALTVTVGLLSDGGF